MRNLKRALSLAVASVMLVGMMVVGTSASYNDVSSDYNQEAIEVLQAISVMVGDDNGNFNPTAAVTRNEMAVIMSNLMDYRVANYAGTAPFTDVPSWAEPYVAACYTNGITAGVGNGLYGGSNTVTTAEAALMLMKALGYFQYASDFGEDWQLATTKQANKIELLDGVDAAVTGTLTRNDVAQLVLNTLKSGIVEPDDSSVVKVDTGDVKVDIGGVNYIYTTSTKSYASAISDDEAASGVTGISTSGKIVELGEKLYQGDLKLDEDVTDDFGRPSTKWTYKLDEIGTFADEPIAVYTAKASKGALYSLIGSSNSSKLSATGDKDIDGNVSNRLLVWEDGVDVTTASIAAGVFDRNSTGAAVNSGKGVLTEVYQDDDNNVTIVVANTYLAQATDDYNADKGDVSITVITGDATDNALEDDDFDIAGIKEDDYILYTYAKGDIQDIQVAKVVTGEVNAYSKGDYVKIDGTQYSYAEKIEGDSKDQTYVVTDTAAIVLDAYGYVIYVDDASISVGNYVYIAATSGKSGLSSSIIADAYFSDGSNEEITIKSIVGTDKKTPIPVPSTVGKNTTAQDWYSYTKTSEGKYKLTLAKTSVVTTVDKIENGKASIGGLVVGNNNTIFLVDDGDDITVYTGIANVPDITDKGNSGIPVAYMLNKDTAGKAAVLVYVDASNAKVKDSSKDSLLYVLKLDSTYVDSADGDPVYSYIVVLEGKTATIETKDSLTVGQLYESYSIDSDGYYEIDNTDVFNYDGENDKAEIDLAVGVSTLAYSAGTLTVVDENGNPTYILLSDTEIVTVLQPDTAKAPTYAVAALKAYLMKDSAAKYEVRSNLSGSALANLVKNYTVDGKISVVYTDDGVNLAKTLYVAINGVDKIPG